MADCKWINTNGGNWSTGANWSTGSAPTSSDNAIIDADSFSADGKTITIDATANCLNFDCSAADQNFTLANAAYNFNVYGSFIGSANLTVTFTGTGYWYFKATTSVNITMASCTFNANRMIFDGVGGKWTSQDNMTANITIYHNNGEWDTNSKTINVVTYTHGIGTKTLTLGSSTFICSASWGSSTTSNIWNTFTLNADTSHIQCVTFITGVHSRTFYNVTAQLHSGYLNHTFNNIIFNASGILNIVVYGTLTVNGLLTINGYSDVARAFVNGYVAGTYGIITVPTANVTVSNIDFRDIKFTNAIDLSAITGGSGDCGGNSGITFTPAQKQYFKNTIPLSLIALDNFDTNKWTILPATVTIGSGVMTYDGTVNFQQCYRALPYATITGKSYRVRFTVVSGTARLSFILGGLGFTGGSATYTVYPVGSYDLNLTAGSNSVDFRLAFSNNSGGTACSIDDFSIEATTQYLWSDSNWFSDESPRTTAGRVPLPQDDVQFDASSFTGTSTLSVNVPRIGKSLDMSAVNQAVTMSLANAIECYGSYVLGNNITPSGSFIIGLLGIGSFVINTLGKFHYGFVVSRYGGTYENQSIINIVERLSINGGTLNLNAFNATIGMLYPFLSGTLNCENSTIITTRTGSPGISFAITPACTIYTNGSTLILNPSGGSVNIPFDGAGKTYNKVWLSGSHTGNFDITGSNTIAELIIDPGRKVRFTAGTTQQIGKYTAIGAAGNLFTVGSITGGTFTLNFTGSNEVESDYGSYSNCIGTPSNKWFVGSHSTDGGGNSGLIFADLTRYYAKASAAGAAIGSGKLQLIGLIKASAAGITMLQATFYEMLLARASASGIASASGSLHQVLSMAAIAEAQVEASAQIALLLQMQAEVSGQANAEAIFNWIQFYDYYFKASAEGISQANAVIQQLIHLVAEALGISEVEAELMVLTYPVEVFRAFSKITLALTEVGSIEVNPTFSSNITTEFKDLTTLF